MKMKIRPQSACIIGWSVAAVCLLAAVALWGTSVDIIAKIAAGLAVCGIAFWLIFGRCPRCGTIARPKDMYCRKCRRWLDVLPGENEGDKTGPAAKE